MASYFLFQKFSDGMCRSASILGTPGALGNVFHGSAVHLLGMTVPSNRGIHRYATKYLKQTFSSSASKQARYEAAKPEIELHRIRRDADILMVLFGFSGLGCLYILRNDDRGSNNKGSRCNCQCHGSNVKQDISCT